MHLKGKLPKVVSCRLMLANWCLKPYPDLAGSCNCSTLLQAWPLRSHWHLPGGQPLAPFLFSSYHPPERSSRPKAGSSNINTQRQWWRCQLEPDTTKQARGRKTGAGRDSDKGTCPNSWNHSDTGPADVCSVFKPWKRTKYHKIHNFLFYGQFLYYTAAMTS